MKRITTTSLRSAEINQHIAEAIEPHLKDWWTNADGHNLWFTTPTELTEAIENAVIDGTLEKYDPEVIELIQWTCRNDGSQIRLVYKK